MYRHEHITVYALIFSTNAEGVVVGNSLWCYVGVLEATTNDDNKIEVILLPTAETII